MSASTAIRRTTRPPRDMTSARQSRTRIIVSYAGVLVVTLAVWQAAVIVAPMPHLLPSPARVVESFGTFAELIFSQTLLTLQGALTGFLVALVVGVILAAVLHHSDWLRRTLWPAIFLAQTTPKVVLFPIILSVIGFGIESSIVASALISFFPIFLNSLSGFGSVSQGVRELAKSMRMSSTRYFLSIESRAALPEIFAGARISINLCVVGALLAEYLGVGKGLGYILKVSQVSVEPGLMFAGVITLIVLTLILTAGVMLAEKLLTPWRSQSFKEVEK